MLLRFLASDREEFMSFRYGLIMADVKILLDSDFPMEFDEGIEQFLSDFKGKEDVRYSICESERKKAEGKLCYESTLYSVYQSEGEYLWEFRSLKETFLLRSENEERTQFHIDIERDTFQKINKTLIKNFLALEVPMLHYHAFWLHASLISWKGKGILFTAPSGTGKSTQADLWQKYQSAEILNGDRSLVRRVEGRYYAYGSVYAGSSRIYRNESAPVSMVVVLRQGEENCLEKMRAGEAFSCVYSEILANPWDERYTKDMVEEVATLLTFIPIYRLTCRPDREAVEVVKKELERLIIEEEK